MTVAPEDFRRALAHFATGVTVMTTPGSGSVHGMTANAFTSVSLDPPLVLVCVDLDAAMHALVEASGVFAVNILSEDQEALSTWFSSERPAGHEAFEGLRWRFSPRTGSPLLEHALAWVDCEVRDVHAAGDHSIFVGEVVDTATDPQARPLIFYASSYAGLADQNVPNSRSPKSPRPGTM